MNPLFLLKGDSLGKTIYNYLAAAALVAFLSWVAFGLVAGKFWHWRAERNDARADRAEANLKVAQSNAKSADTGAAIATDTRATMDRGTGEIRITVEQAAGRIERYESISVDDGGALPADLVRELQTAHDRAGAAADRLQRTRPR